MSELARDDSSREISQAEGMLFADAVDWLEPLMSKSAWANAAPVLGVSDSIIESDQEAWFDLDGRDVCANKNVGGCSVVVFEDSPSVNPGCLIVTERRFSVVQESEMVPFYSEYHVANWEINSETGEKRRLRSELEQAIFDSLRGEEYYEEHRGAIAEALRARRTKIEEFEELTGLKDDSSRFTLERLEEILKLLGRIRPEHQIRRSS